MLLLLLGSASFLLWNTSIALAPSHQTTEYSVVQGNSFETSHISSYNGLPSQVLGDIVERLDWPEILEKLAMCESSKRTDIVILDSNGKLSYGLYQYQKSTWIAKMKQYNLAPNAEEEELMNLIFDHNYQTKLTLLILKDGGWRNWLICCQRIGCY